MKKLLQQEENNRPHKRIVNYAKFGVAILFLVLVLEIWMMNRLSTFGDKINQLKVNKASLILENQVLENRIARKVSLLNIESKASQQGLQSVKNIEYIKAPALAAL